MPWALIGLCLQPAWGQKAINAGEALFQSRCAVCHGVNADGKSDLARIMRPAPANLRTSKLDDAQQARIVRKGGESVNRSPNMPTWEGELTENELLAVLTYIGTLKAAQP